MIPNKNSVEFFIVLTIVFCLMVQNYDFSYTHAKNNVAKYDTYVSLQQIVHILQHF